MDDLRGQAYSDLLTNPEFWNSMPTENLLLIQTDTMCLGGDGFDGIEEYDYAGAPWWLQCPQTKYVFSPDSGPYRPTAISQGWALGELWPKLVGNGGLSFRKKSAMVECCRKFCLQSSPRRGATVVVGKDGTYRPVTAEDVFRRDVPRLKKKIPTREVAGRFAREEIMPECLEARPACFGLHKPYPYHPAAVLKLVLESSELLLRDL